MDDRTEEERGLKVRATCGSVSRTSLTQAQPLQENRFRIPKSRYASVSLYISDVWYNRPEYNDIYAPYDRAIFERLRDHGTRATTLY